MPAAVSHNSVSRNVLIQMYFFLYNVHCITYNSEINNSFFLFLASVEDNQNNLSKDDKCIKFCMYIPIVVVVVDLPLLRVAVERSDDPISLEKPCQASLPPDQQGHHSLGRHPEVQYIA